MPHQLIKDHAQPHRLGRARSVSFYCDVLCFRLETTVPDAAPYVSASVQSGSVEVFLNAPDAAYAEYPAFRDRAIGGTLTLFIEVVDSTGVYESRKDRVTSCPSGTSGTG